MTDRYGDDRTRNPRDDTAPGNAQTSRNREESMKDSGKDAFADKNPRRDRNATNQADGTKTGSELDPASSGTTPLGGESQAANDRPGPGGVEGESGTT